MPRRLPTLSLALGIVAAGFVLSRPTAGDAQDQEKGKVVVAAPADQFQKVHIDLVGEGEPPIEGTLQHSALPLRTDIGTRVIDMKHVGRVTFAMGHSEHSNDTVQLASKDIVRGHVTIEEFKIETGDGVRSIQKETIREIRVLRAMDLSLAAILVGLLTLTAMEIVLGIDNVIFLAIVAGKLPEHQQAKARRIGLGAALGTRLLLLFTLSFLLGLTAPIFILPDLPLLHDLEAREVSWRDIILFAGGLFLIGKSVFEIHEKLEHARSQQESGGQAAPKRTTFLRAIVTIAILDIVFSLDSVITAVGMVDQLWVMVTAMVIAMIVMLIFAGPISRYVDHHPTIKILALAFLILIGVLLVAESLGQHIDKGYIYFAMPFSVVMEMINVRLRGSSKTQTEATAEMPEKK
jgi:predicted tellurium resistance membrane protein TerC